MEDPECVEAAKSTESVEIACSSLKFAVVLAVIAHHCQKGAMGIRISDIYNELGISYRYIEEILIALEKAGLVQSWYQQIGTGGTNNGLYKPTTDDHITISGPAILNALTL